MLEGSNLICTYEDEEENSPELTARVKVANSISQLIISNAIKRASKSNQLTQMKERETPLTIYKGLKSHARR